jgi:hemolysin III
VSKQKRPQTINEERLNSLSHGITAVAAIGGLVVLLWLGFKSEREWSMFSAILFGFSLLALYTFSSIYHGLKDQRAKKVFKILDHSGIFLLIAGSYTPVLLISIGGVTGWVFFGIQWGMALVGIILKIFYVGKFKGISTAIYALMGWIVIFKIELVLELLPAPAFWLLAASGMAYTVGIIFYTLDSRIKYGHFVWHLFVMAGSIIHFIMVVKYVLV